MEHSKIADRLTEQVMNKTAAIISGKRFTLVLRKDDFKSQSVWNAILDDMNVQYGEEADFNEPDEVELKVIGGKAF